MFEDISIKLNPYLGRSKNLMEFFVIIGYEEKILEEYAQSHQLENNNLDLEMSIISSVISDLAYGVFDPDRIIKQIYPDKPKIIKISKKEEPIPISSALFYSCFDSIVGKNKVLYACYALRFYEKFNISKSSYYVPKAILIFSQYPYFTTFHNICLNTYEQIRNYKTNENNDNENSFPIEILMHCLVNYIPSPINNDLKLMLFDRNNPIIIKKLTGYPYIDFDLCKVFTFMPINEFIKIYMLTFLEIALLFFSPNLVKLNLFMYILNILNYPLIDSGYYWHIKSISKDEIKFGEDTLNPTFRGVNANFNHSFDFKNFRNLNYIVDIENKEIKCIREENDESKEISKLLKYISNILKGKKVRSYFLNDYLSTLKEKLNRIRSDYEKRGRNKTNSFFYIDKTIIEINEQMQEAFYDFILNILIQLNKDYKLDSNCTKIFKNVIKNPEFSEEENIFLKYYRNAIKYNTYFELFISNFTAVDELKVSLIFSDEYVNVKMRDSKKEIPDKINYFKLMDNFYSLSRKEKEFDSQKLKEEFEKTYKTRAIKTYIRPTDNQLFELDKNLIKIFLFHKKSRDLFKSLKIKEKEEIKLDSIDKINIIGTIENYFYSLLNRQNYIRIASIFIFSIVFPLFPKKRTESFLKEILKNLNKIKFFQRYYIYILLKSIHKYYLINKENNNFPELTFENIKTYCTLIKDYLINNSFLPNEEIFLFLEKVLSNDEKKINEIKNKKIKIDKNNFVFQYENEDNYENNIPDNFIIKDKKNKLNFKYKGLEYKCKLIIDAPVIYQGIYSAYDTYFTSLNFNIVKIPSVNIIELIINVIYYLLNYEDKNLTCYLLNSIIVLEKLKKDLKSYNENNNNNENNNINNENNNINNENNNINNINNENNNINNDENNNIININNKNNIINNDENNIINNDDENNNIININNENNIIINDANNNKNNISNKDDEQRKPSINVNNDEKNTINNN